MSNKRNGKNKWSHHHGFLSINTLKVERFTNERSRLIIGYK